MLVRTQLEVVAKGLFLEIGRGERKKKGFPSSSKWVSLSPGPQMALLSWQDRAHVGGKQMEVIVKRSLSLKALVKGGLEVAEQDM